MNLFSKEPAVIVGLVQAALVLAVSFGFDLTGEQVGAITAFAAAILALVVRSSVVSPATVADAAELPQEVTGLAGRLIKGLKANRGSIPMALIILIGLAVVLMAGLAVCSDALFEDEDETDDLGLPALVVDHECYDCDDWGGGSDGNSGGRYEGGRSGDMEQGDGRNCRNFCDNVIYIPDPRDPDRDDREAGRSGP